jgi:Skp family chaperone for outer membrane proteins
MACSKDASAEEDRTMSRKLGLAAGAVALSLGVYLASRLWAQEPAPPDKPPAAKAPAQTRVAFVNLVQVIKKYHKYKTFEDEQKALAKPYEELNTKLKGELKELQKVVDNPTSTAQQKEEAEQQITENKRLTEDNVRRFKKVMGKRGDEGLVQLYKEVDAAVKRYAVAQGFDVVLQFNEPATEAEKYSPMNIQRKLQGSASTGCCIPVYIAPGLDITASVIARINAGKQAAR